MIDLRSDTVTKPTEEMRKAAYQAKVGDDVYNEDPTVRRLEELAAQMLGKEDALFVTSGTQGNQIAVLTHCVPGNEILLEEDSHIFYYEGGAVSAFAGVQTRTIKGHRGAMDPTLVEVAIRGEDIHVPETGLICLENTHNRAGGAIVPIDNMESIYNVASKYNVPVHLDGARLFNAAVALNKPLTDFTKFTTTVQVCLSKGLGAPVGSIIAGDEQFIKKARKWRKRLGGGLRQVGLIAAPAMVALTQMVERLSVDHDNAKRLAAGIGSIKGLEVINEVDTNIVLIDVAKKGLTAEEYIRLLKEQGILAVSFGPTIIRMTTHYDVSTEQIDQALAILQK
ncbi:aminotransferase class I/II-fold pyridoxal phosphate-dependent enzyme [Bacillus luteolus]|uniref:Aminotransferase class I/II-fold pyridoxal phosphate-dependent enzyme n=1 Tax=Litchfieldia luteola TaxID=682179 RepID=A0ABR9QIR4_9BACI|nr:GntG family PLP-dependent aldolase [Cytobacillus luteolus]MBE4908390.1 aminotransferase class I/II-fold pyridoxal phosphate-dependent enzyme [Cytobacillus luteolus]MBP1943178.1 threonine aldolase [Cytobacillus luteolus]